LRALSVFRGCPESPSTHRKPLDSESPGHPVSASHSRYLPDRCESEPVSSGVLQRHVTEKTPPAAFPIRAFASRSGGELRVDCAPVRAPFLKGPPSLRDFGAPARTGFLPEPALSLRRGAFGPPVPVVHVADVPPALPTCVSHRHPPIERTGS